MVRVARLCAMNGPRTAVGRLASPDTRGSGRYGIAQSFYARVGTLRANILETLKLSWSEIRMNIDIRNRVASLAM